VLPLKNLKGLALKLKGATGIILTKSPPRLDSQLCLKRREGGEPSMAVPRHHCWVPLLLGGLAAAEAGLLGKDATALTPENFDSTVINTDLPWVVGFYAPWCGHCKNLAQPFGKVCEREHAGGRAGGRVRPPMRLGGGWVGHPSWGGGGIKQLLESRWDLWVCMCVRDGGEGAGEGRARAGGG